MNFNMNSVIKAGGIAAGIGLVLAVLGAIPFIQCLVIPLLCVAWFALPIAAGMLYGYYTPGKETTGESALGGALAGGFGGLVYGILNGILGAVTSAGTMAALEGIEGMPQTAGAGVGSILIAVCVSVFGGLIFGALGGILWPMFQNRKTI